MKNVDKYICVQKERDYKNTVLNLRLSEPEAVRFWVIMDLAKSRSPYANKSDIYRELLGLQELQVLNESDILYFRTGEKPQKLKNDYENNSYRNGTN